MDNVINFFDRGQKWTSVHRVGNLSASVSSRGRLSLRLGDQETELTFVEFVHLLSDLSAALEGETEDLYEAR